MRNHITKLSALCRQPFLKIIGACFIVLMILLTQVLVPKMHAAASDFGMDGTKLVKYAGTDSSVTIPNNVTVISSEAFADNTTMTSLSIPDSVSKIETNAFSGCTALKGITIPDSVKEIGKSAFRGCTSVSSLSIGSGLSTLETCAFGGLTSLKDATISENNPNFYCEDGVIYDRGQSTVYQMLAGRTSTDYTMPSKVKKIQEYAFWDCANLKKISLSNNLTEVPAYAFSNCTGLTSVTLPYSIKSIQTKAFENCANLSEIQIPESVSFIHETAFDGCPLVKDSIKTTEMVTDQEATDQKATDDSATNKESVTENESNNASETNTQDTPQKVVQEKQIDGMEKQESADVIGKTKIIGGQALVLIDPKNTNVITDGVSSKSVQNEQDTSADGTTLLKNAYYRNTDLKSYVFDSKVTKIEDLAFARSGLKSIKIPSNVTDIGYAAFYHCDELEKVSIPESVQNISGKAFEKTPWMTQWLNQSKSYSSTGEESEISSDKPEDDYLVVGDGILIAYRGTDKKVVIPDTVKQIATGAFKDHTEIQDVVLPDTNIQICDKAFEGCSNLKEPIEQ